MNNDYAVMRNKAVALAKRLKWAVEDVPLSFQVQELEDYINKAEQEVAARGLKR